MSQSIGFVRADDRSRESCPTVEVTSFARGAGLGVGVQLTLRTEYIQLTPEGTVHLAGLLRAAIDPQRKE
jgi:hypothetical protein